MVCARQPRKRGHDVARANHYFERRGSGPHMSDRPSGHAKIFSRTEDVEWMRGRDEHAALSLTEQQGSER